MLPCWFNTQRMPWPGLAFPCGRHDWHGHGMGLGAGEKGEHGAGPLVPVRAALLAIASRPWPMWTLTVAESTRWGASLAGSIRAMTARFHHSTLS